MKRHKLFYVFYYGLPICVIIDVVNSFLTTGWVALFALSAALFAILTWYFLFWRSRNHDMWSNNAN